MNSIEENVKKILDGLPGDVELVAAAKTRSPEEIEEAIGAGLTIIGENYIQEAEKAFEVIGKKVKWHFIGHLQKNKVKKAVKIFDLIETVDSYPLAREINERCKQINKIMPILIEVNSGREKQKFGVFPEDVLDLVKKISSLPQIKIIGLMTMGPRFGNPEDSRIYFKETKNIFEKLRKLNLPHMEMKYLSMGMTNSYRIAIKEKANMVRIGTLIFGERSYKN
ncbi:MAG: YggS family pyridoxal phosphate-dependent enzyme [Candidatus Caldatribacteriota bacterium]|nr:YggS family pyridoxal phosphate-dependent enzyme [Candidatus Caldatribacteriota bacterium]